jgi:hypothetical protein
MKSGPALAVAAAAALWAPALAHGADLTVVNVSAPAVNCVFNASCTVVVNDSVGTLAYTPLGNGAFVQSRTYPGEPGTPGAGLRVPRRPHPGDRLHRMPGRAGAQFRTGREADLSASA